MYLYQSTVLILAVSVNVLTQVPLILLMSQSHHIVHLAAPRMTTMLAVSGGIMLSIASDISLSKLRLHKRFRVSNLTSDPAEVLLAFNVHR